MDFIGLWQLDLTVHITCFIIFLVLPTTNVRPEIAGNYMVPADA